MKTNHHKQHEGDKTMDHNPKGEKDKYSDIFEFRTGDDKLLRPLQNVYGKRSDIYRKAEVIATNNEDYEDTTIEPAQDLQPTIKASNIEPAQDLQPAIEACTIERAQDLQPAIENNYLGQELQPAIQVESTGQMLEHQTVIQTNADDHSINLQSMISSIVMIESEADEFLELKQVISSDIENDVITSDKAQTRRLYVKYFPNDKTNNARSYNFMVNKLQKKGLKIADLAS